MPLAPWRLYKSWSCLKCGICCRKYTVNLSEGEADFYFNVFGRKAVDKVNGVWVIRKFNGRCVFQVNGLCSIQEFKPRNCRLWPFIVMRKPLNRRTAKLAEIEFKGETFYVYVDTFCFGLNTGESPIEIAVLKAVKDYLSYSPERAYLKKKYGEFRKVNLNLNIFGLSLNLNFPPVSNLGSRSSSVIYVREKGY